MKKPQASPMLRVLLLLQPCFGWLKCQRKYLLLVIFMQLALKKKYKKNNKKKSFRLTFYKPLYYANSETGARNRLLCSLPSSPTERLVALCLIMNGLQKAHFTVL